MTLTREALYQALSRHAGHAVRLTLIRHKLLLVCGKCREDLLEVYPGRGKS